MPSIVANKLKFLLATGVINFNTDVFKIILMSSGFVFNPDTHCSYSNVSASELPSGHGYTVNSKVLTNVQVVEDSINDRINITWSNVTWTASGGSIGPTPGAIIFDSVVTTPVANPIVGYIDFGGEQTQVDGGVATISNIELRIA